MLRSMLINDGARAGTKKKDNLWGGNPADSFNLTKTLLNKTTKETPVKKKGDIILSKYTDPTGINNRNREYEPLKHGRADSMDRFNAVTAVPTPYDKVRGGSPDLGNFDDAYAGDPWDTKKKIIQQTPLGNSNPTYGPGGSTLADAGSIRQEDEQAKIDAGYYEPGGAYYDNYEPYTPTPDYDPSTDQRVTDLEAQLTGDPTFQASGVISPEMRSAGSMAELLDMDYNQANIRALLDKATSTQYANLDNEHARAQRDFYNMSGRNAADLRGAMRRSDRSAAMSRASRGSQMANDLAQLQQASSMSAEGATELSQLRAQLVGEREAAMAGNAGMAFDKYSEMGINLGTLSKQELDANMIGYSADKASEVSLQEAQISAAAMRDQSLRNQLGAIEAAKIRAAADKEGYAAQRYASEKEERWLANQYWRDMNNK